MAEATRTKLIGHPPIPDTEIQKGGGCFVFFGLPFIAVGACVMLLSFGILPLDPASLDGPPQLLTAFGIVFTGAGLAVVWFGIAGVLRARSARKRKEDHPLEPWFQDHPWNTKWAESGSFGPVVQTFVFFAFFATFLSMFNWWAFMSKDSVLFVKAIVSIFDLVALLVLLAAFYKLFQYLKYGKSRLHFARFPFRTGGTVDVRLEAHRRLLDAPKINLTLRYIEEVMERHGKNTSQVLYLLHEVKQDLSSGQFGGSPEGGIPISLRLPAGTFSNRLIETPRRYWELEVKAETPGVDYAAWFLIPVY